MTGERKSSDFMDEHLISYLDVLQEENSEETTGGRLDGEKCSIEAFPLQADECGKREAVRACVGQQVRDGLCRLWSNEEEKEEAKHTSHLLCKHRQAEHWMAARPSVTIRFILILVRLQTPGVNCAWIKVLAWMGNYLCAVIAYFYAPQLCIIKFIHIQPRVLPSCFTKCIVITHLTCERCKLSKA